MSHAIKRAVAVVTVLAAFAAISAPAASARFDLNPPSANEPAQTAAPASTTPAISTSSSSGFDWGDAAIGAGVALVLVTLGGGAVLMSRRQARSRPATTS
ncbi:MAG TPA: hypothetical protein VGJ61_07825 [Solirubrobacterales bacterium]